MQLYATLSLSVHVLWHLGYKKMWISKEWRDNSLTKCMYQLALATSVLLHINAQLFFKESGKPVLGPWTPHSGTNNGIIWICLASWSISPYIIWKGPHIPLGFALTPFWNKRLNYVSRDRSCFPLLWLVNQKVFI